MKNIIIITVLALSIIVNCELNSFAGFRIGLSDVIYNAKKELDNKYKEIYLANSTSAVFVSQNINYNSQTIYDGYLSLGSGNKDGIVNKGETIIMSITLANTGDSTIYGVTGELSTSDSYVTMVSSYSTASFGTISATNGTKSNSAYSSPFMFNVANNAPPGHVVNFNMLVKDSNNNTRTVSFTTTIQDISATVIYNSATVYDGYFSAGTGNKNALINAGESIVLEIILKNTGTSSVYGVSGDLTTSDPYIVIDSSYSTASFGIISGNNGVKSNNIYSSPYKIDVSSTTPSGHTITFNLNIYDSFWNVWNAIFAIKVQ